MRLIVRLLIVIFLLIIAAEVIFYFFLSNQNPIINQETENTGVPVLTPSITNNKSFTSSNNLDPNLFDALLQSSSEVPTDLLNSYIVTATLTGSISEIKTNPNKDALYEIVLTGVNGGVHHLIIPPDSAKQKTAVEVIDADGTISLDNLQNGDKINIVITMDITNSKTGLSTYIWKITKLPN